MIKLEKEMKALLSEWRKQLDTYKKDWVGKEISRDVHSQIARDLGVSYVTFYDKNGDSDFYNEYQEPMIITSEWNIVTEGQYLNYISTFDEIYLDIKVKRKPKGERKIMKYYYGNSMKEAMSNPAVEIKSTKQLRQYEENYSIVVPVAVPDEESDLEKVEEQK